MNRHRGLVAAAVLLGAFAYPGSLLRPTDHEGAVRVLLVALPEPLSMGAIGGLLGFAVGGGLAWWLTSRMGAPVPPPPAEVAAPEGDGPSPSRRPELDLRLARTRPSAAGPGPSILDFDQVISAIQDVFRWLDGRKAHLYTQDVPQMTAEVIASRFSMDLVVVLLENGNGMLRTMGAVGLRTAERRATVPHAPDLVEELVRTGPRVVTQAERSLLMQIGLSTDRMDTLATIPFIQDGSIFGLLLVGRREHNGNGGQPGALAEHIRDIASDADNLAPYLRAWLLLRSLKMRLGGLV
jgi:hypothetical protein